MAELVPKRSRNQARRELAQSDCRAEPSDGAGPQLLRREVRRDASGHRPEASLIKPVKQEKNDQGDDVFREREARVNDQKHHTRAEQDIFPSPFVGERADRIGNQRRHQVESRVDQCGHRQRAADLLGAQNEKRIARVADAEQRKDEEIFPVGGREASGADDHLPAGAVRRPAPRHKKDHCHRQQARNEGAIEDGANIDLQRIQQKHRHDWTKESTRILAQSFEAEPGTSMTLVD